MRTGNIDKSTRRTPAFLGSNLLWLPIAPEYVTMGWDQLSIAKELVLPVSGLVRAYPGGAFAWRIAPKN
jgi:hypothetical protein